MAQRSKLAPTSAQNPWESIVEAGFQTTLAGIENGKVFGPVVYFTRDFALSHRYALQSVRVSSDSAKSSKRLRDLFECSSAA
jgi:hypothetical protein